MGYCITPEDFLGVMYYIGKINTGVPPRLRGVPFNCLGGGGGRGGLYTSMLNISDWLPFNQFTTLFPFIL